MTVDTKIPTPSLLRLQAMAGPRKPNAR